MGMSIMDKIKMRRSMRRRQDPGKAMMDVTPQEQAFNANDFHQKEDHTSSAGNAGQIDRNRNWQQGRSTSQFSR